MVRIEPGYHEDGFEAYDEIIKIDEEHYYVQGRADPESGDEAYLHIARPVDALYHFEEVVFDERPLEPGSGGEGGRE